MIGEVILSSLNKKDPLYECFEQLETSVDMNDQNECNH